MAKRPGRRSVRSAPAKASPTWPMCRSVWKRWPSKAGDAAGLLAAVLQGVQAERGQRRRPRRRRRPRTRRTPGAGVSSSGVTNGRRPSLGSAVIGISPPDRRSRRVGARRSRLLGRLCHRDAVAVTARSKAGLQPCRRCPGPSGASAVQQPAHGLRPAARWSRLVIQCGCRSGGVAALNIRLSTPSTTRPRDQADAEADAAVERAQHVGLLDLPRDGRRRPAAGRYRRRGRPTSSAAASASQSGWISVAGERAGEAQAEDRQRPRPRRRRPAAIDLARRAADEADRRRDQPAGPATMRSNWVTRLSPMRRRRSGATASASRLTPVDGMAPAPSAPAGRRARGESPAWRPPSGAPPCG